MRSVYVITHTEAQHHVDGLVGGWYDSELTTRGHAQAELVARRVRSLIPEGASVPVFSSDLRRAAQTAAPVAAELGSSVEEMAGLREMSYGEAGGRPDAWLRERFTAAPPADRMDHRSGLPGAENKREVATRVYAAVERILDRNEPHQVIVTHGGTLTFVVMAWARIPLDGIGWIALSASPGGITHLVEDDYYRNRRVAFLNDADHLRHA